MRILDDSLCGSCRQSGLLSFHEDGDGEYEAETARCYGCVPLEQERDKDRREAGLKLYVRDLHDDPR